jgi:acetyl-CoA acyltransferase
MSASTDPVVVVGGCRTPFLKSSTDFIDLNAYDLARLALRGLLLKTRVDPDHIDAVILGCVVQDMRFSNVAREAALAAGLPKTVPCHTVTQACISANQAITSGVEAIVAGAAQIVVAGGTETASDVPIRYKRSMRKRMIATQKYRKPSDWMGFVRGLKPRDLAPEMPSISEFSTGLTMGQSCDRITARVGISREDQDAFAIRSHRLAHQSTANGWFDDEIHPVTLTETGQTVLHDNGPRADSSPEKLARLRPAFNKPHGTATAANSSFLTDGASAVLLMRRSRAAELELSPLAAVRSYGYAGSDSLDELLLGPAFSTPIALDRAGLALADLQVVEIHEAFAGSVLAALRLLASEDFARSELGRASAVGEIDLERVNAHGGSLSIGHPFGATGGRLVLSACRRLHDEDAELALVTACAAGGLGHAMVLERV